MKALVEGVWQSPVTDIDAYQAARAAQTPDLFRGWVRAAGGRGFTAEPGRYHLYVSHACPFAHRTTLMRALKGLEQAISVSVLHPRWAGPQGWQFTADPAFPEVTEDHVNGDAALWQTYVRAQPRFTGKVVVPVLWDKAQKTIVSTESADILRMLDCAFDAFATNKTSYYPEELRAEIDELAAIIRPRINGGVYAVGFATSQDGYDRAVAALFAALDDLEARLAHGQPFLLGERMTEADLLLFPTLVRFDAVYHGALRCNLRMLRNYPGLSALARRVHAIPGVAETVKLDHVRRHYYDDLGLIDPTILPAGPLVDFAAEAASAAA